MGVGRRSRHVLSDHWSVRYAFPLGTMKAIERAIATQEQRHDGELRFAVESALPFSDLVRGISARDRAIELFSRLRIWDTEQNAGVLVYLLLADKRVEIVADRGIHAKVGERRGRRSVARCSASSPPGGSSRASSSASRRSATCSRFPPRDQNPDELSNRPIVLP